MFAISRNTSTACSVTSGPTPSPGSTTIFSFILVECCDWSQLLSINQRLAAGLVPLTNQRRTSPPSKRHRRKAVTSHRTPKSRGHGPRPLFSVSGDRCFRRDRRIGYQQRNQVLIVNSL